VYLYSAKIKSQVPADVLYLHKPAGCASVWGTPSGKMGWAWTPNSTRWWRPSPETYHHGSS